MGSRHEEQARKALRRYARIIQQAGFPCRFHDFHITNVAATAAAGFEIQLEALASSDEHALNCIYEPEIASSLNCEKARCCLPAIALSVAFVFLLTGVVCVRGRMMADKIEDPICGKKITVMIFANGSMNFLGGRSRQAIYDAYDTMTRKEEPVGFLREFAIGISDVPPTPRGSNSSSVLSRATSLAAQPPMSKEEVVDEAIDAAEDAVDDGDEGESKTLSVGVRKNLRRDLLKCFSDGDDEGDAKPWPLIEAKLRAYITDKKKSLKSTEMAAVLAGSLKRLLPRRDDDAAAAAAAQREAQAAAAKAAVSVADDATAGEARAPATLAAAPLGASDSPLSPADAVAGDDVVAGHDARRPFAGAGVKRKADDAQLDSPGGPAAQTSADAIAEIENAASSSVAAGGSANPAAGGLDSMSGGESEPQPVQLGAGQAVKFGFGRAIRGGGAAKKPRGNVFGFAGGDDDDD